MISAILHGFPPQLATYLRAGGHHVVEVASHGSAEHQWRDLVTARQVMPGPMNAEAIQLLRSLLSDAAIIFDLYARHFELNQADQLDFRGMLELHVRFALHLLRAKRPDVVAFATIPHEGYDYVLFLVARRLGIDCLVCYQTPFPNRFWLMKNGWNFRALDVEPADQGCDPAAGLPEIDLFYMQGIDREPSFTLVDAARESIRRPAAMPGFAFRWQRAAIYRHRLRRSIRRAKQASKPFVYFPLHLQPELTTSMFGGVFTDQVLALEWLRAIVPEEMWIIAKENPRQTEMCRGRQFFDRMNKIPSLVLVDAATPTSDLIAGCEAVATVSGTAGWEGLLAGKPAILFGRAWYEGFDGVYSAEGITPSELPAGPDRSRLEKSFARRMARSHEGVADEDYISISPGFNPQENARKVGDVLLSKIQDI